jgi:hypothetical protein
MQVQSNDHGLAHTFFTRDEPGRAVLSADAKLLAGAVATADRALTIQKALVHVHRDNVKGGRRAARSIDPVGLSTTLPGIDRWIASAI